MGDPQIAQTERGAQSDIPQISFYLGSNRRNLAGALALAPNQLVGTGLALSVCEALELRKEVAFSRFLHLQWRRRRHAGPAARTRAVRAAEKEADLVTSATRVSASELQEVAAACLGWSGDRGLDPTVWLRSADMAVRAAALAVRTALSDYELWLCLARAHALLGLQDQAAICLEKAQELAPPHMQLTLSEQ